MARLRWSILTVLVILALTSSEGAWAAARCPATGDASPRLENVDPELRLQFIDEHLARTAHRAQLWTWGWGIAIGASTIGNLVPLAFVAPDDRIDWYVSAGTTVIGFVPLAIAPLDVVADSRTLRARLATRSSADDLCALLADAELKLARDARNQADGQRWWLHAGNVVLNVGVGLFLALGYHHWGAGIYNAALGSAIGEAIILTQPTSSITDLQTYREGSFARSPSELSLAYATTF